MHSKVVKTRLSRFYSLAAAVLSLSSISRPVFAAEKAFIILPGEASATADSKAAREISPNCWRQLTKLEVRSASFVKPSHPRAAPLRTCTKWKLNFATL